MVAAIGFGTPCGAAVTPFNLAAGVRHEIFETLCLDTMLLHTGPIWSLGRVHLRDGRMPYWLQPQLVDRSSLFQGVGPAETSGIPAIEETRIGHRYERYHNGCIG